MVSQDGAIPSPNRILAAASVNRLRASQIMADSDETILSHGFVLLPTACCTTRVLRTKHEAMKNVAGAGSGWDITGYGAAGAQIGPVTVHPETPGPLQAILHGELACSNDKRLQTALPTRIPIDLMIS